MVKSRQLGPRGEPFFSGPPRPFAEVYPDIDELRLELQLRGGETSVFNKPNLVKYYPCGNPLCNHAVSLIQDTVHTNQSGGW